MASFIQNASLLPNLLQCFPRSKFLLASKASCQRCTINHSLLMTRLDISTKLFLVDMIWKQSKIVISYVAIYFSFGPFDSSSVFRILHITYKIHRCQIKNTSNFELYYVINCVKSVQIRSYCWSAFSCIQSKYRKIWARNNSVFGHFSRSDKFIHRAQIAEHRFVIYVAISGRY